MSTSSTKAMTPEFRVAFPSVFQARKNDLNGKDEFSVVALFPKDADLKPLHLAAQAALVAKFGPDKKKWPTKMRSPFRDQGDRAKNENGKEVLPQGYEKGLTYLTLRSQQKPGVVDKDVQEIIDTSEFYGGCWARASINAYAYDIKGNRGVSFGLGNLQKVKDGDAFGNRTKPQDDFSPVADATEDNTQSSDNLFS